MGIYPGKGPLNMSQSWAASVHYQRTGSAPVVWGLQMFIFIIH